MLATQAINKKEIIMYIEASKFQSNVYETCIDNGTGAFLKVDAYLYEYQHIALLSDNFRVFILWIIVG